MRLRISTGLVGVAVIAANFSPAGSNVVRNHPLQQSARSISGTSVSLRGPVTASHRFVGSKAGKGDIYVSDASANVVYGYASTGGSPIYTATGFNQPQGLAATKKYLYVADTKNSQVVVLKPPSTTAIGTIADPGFFLAGIAVNGNGSAIWVSNICSAPSCAQGNLSEFDNNGNLLGAIVCKDLARDYFVAVDKAGNVAVDGVDGFGTAHVDLISAGTNACTPLTSISLEFPGGLQFTTKGDLAVDDQSAQTVTTYAAPAFTSALSITPLKSGSVNVSDPVTFAFTKRDGDLWTANAGSGNLTEFAYPDGGTAVNSISVQPAGVAVQPPAKVGSGR